MELADLAIEIERYAVSKGLNTKTTTVSELIKMMFDEGLEE